MLSSFASVAFVGSSVASAVRFASASPAPVSVIASSLEVRYSLAGVWSGVAVGAGASASLLVACPSRVSSASFSFGLALRRASRGRGAVLVLPSGFCGSPAFWVALRSLGFTPSAVSGAWVCPVGVVSSLPPLFGWAASSR
ncbi:hypothetical protein [Runella slithyformis]|uniref:hypothetical protein n=1 Tax=Runella slithyformis TaxID=106 RepID=UPI0002F984D8|nr:hypothetical protein [Runella slithyformis]